MNDFNGLEARLKELEAAAASRVGEPLDPDTVRRLGTRRRHRRWLGTVLLAVILVVSGGVGVVAAGALPGRQPPSPAGLPTGSPTPTSSAPGQVGSTEPSEWVGHGEITGPRRGGPGRQPSAPAPYPTYSAGPTGAPSGTPEVLNPTSSASSSAEPSDSTEPTESSVPAETSEPPHSEPPEATKPPATSEPDSGAGDAPTAPAPNPGDSATAGG